MTKKLTKGVIIIFKVEGLRNEIDKLKVDLVQLAESKQNLQAQKVIDKSQELDELIVSYMKDKLSS